MDNELTKSKRTLILINACIATFMATLDGSIVNIALPVISRSLLVDINTVQWIVTSYLLTIVALLLIWGKLSDLYGRKFLFAAGMAVFTFGSLLCGISLNFPMLVFSRVLQAMGASITMALTQGIVTSIFPANERGRALGAVGTVVAVGSLLGPSLGGILVRLSGWQSIFLINIPFGIAGIVMTFLVMPNENSVKKSIEFDFKGTAMFMAGILMLFVALLLFQDGVLTSNSMVILVLASVILLGTFIWYERKQENPLIHMDLFKNKVFSSGLATSYLSFVSIFSYIFLMPFYLQRVLNMDILTAGLLMSLYPVATAIISPISGWLSDKISYRPLTIVGLSLNTVAFALLSGLNASSSKIQVALLILLLGVGGALFQSPNNSSVMGAVPRNMLGIAGSINAFFRTFGMVSGTTISVLLFMFVTKIGMTSISENSFDSLTFLKGFKVVLLSAAIFCLIGLFISLLRTDKRVC